MMTDPEEDAAAAKAAADFAELEAEIFSGDDALPDPNAFASVATAARVLRASEAAVRDRLRAAGIPVLRMAPRGGYLVPKAWIIEQAHAAFAPLPLTERAADQSLPEPDAGGYTDQG